MKRYIASDSGKFATKVALAAQDLSGYRDFGFRTKTGPGSFDDDAVEVGTYIATIDGITYKIGNGAPKEAELETSKKTETHRNCTMLALALAASEDGKTDFSVAIGMPVGPYRNVDERKAYKEYMLPLGPMEVAYMGQDGKIIKKSFNIANRYVYPESAGALYIDMEANHDTAAVVDMGNLNVGATLYQNCEPDYESSNSSELGGQILISGLAAALSAEYSSRIDNRLVSSILRLPAEQRFLTPVRQGTGIEESSKKFIDNYLLEHVKDVKRMCDSLRWPLDFMKLTFIGGTSDLLRNEIKAVFGESASIPEKPSTVNARGFLRRLVAWEEKKLLPMKEVS